jgi:hypothetical protein
MTKKRWIVLAGLLAAAVGLTLAVLALLPSRPGVTQGNFDRIADGMSQDEVETIFGGPGESLLGRSIVAWSHNRIDRNVIIYFDDRDHVIGKEWKWRRKRRGPPETFLQKLYRFFRL